MSYEIRWYPNSWVHIKTAHRVIGGVSLMDIGDEVKAVNVIKPRTVVPMHYLKNRPVDFAKRFGEYGSVELKILRSGESLIYK